MRRFATMFALVLVLSWGGGVASAQINYPPGPGAQPPPGGNVAPPRVVNERPVVVVRFPRVVKKVKKKVPPAVVKKVPRPARVVPLEERVVRPEEEILQPQVRVVGVEEANILAGVEEARQGASVLSRTGSDLLPLALAGAGAVLVGLQLVASARRRRPAGL